MQEVVNDVAFIGSFHAISGDTKNNGEMNKCWWTDKASYERAFVCRPPAWRRWRNVKTTYFTAVITGLWFVFDWEYGSNDQILQRNCDTWYKPPC